MDMRIACSNLLLAALRTAREAVGSLPDISPVRPILRSCASLTDIKVYFPPVTSSTSSISLSDDIRCSNLKFPAFMTNDNQANSGTEHRVQRSLSQSKGCIYTRGDGN